MQRQIIPAAESFGSCHSIWSILSWRVFRFGIFSYDLKPSLTGFEVGFHVLAPSAIFAGVAGEIFEASKPHVILDVRGYAYSYLNCTLFLF